MGTFFFLDMSFVLRLHIGVRLLWVISDHATLMPGRQEFTFLARHL